MSAANRAVYYSAASNINSWNIFRIGSDFLPWNHKIWFLISIFPVPPWSLQNMIEYLSSLGINNRLHIDIRNMHCSRALTDGVHRGVTCHECQDLDCVAKHICLSCPLAECKLKNTKTINLAAYLFLYLSTFLSFDFWRPTQDMEVLCHILWHFMKSSASKKKRQM